jgi:integrase
VNTHVIPVFGDRRVTNFRRDDLQGFLDAKCAAGLSFSMVDHLRWDLKQMFEMAVVEDLIGKNPAKLLFTRGDAKRGERLVMTTEEVKRCFAVLDLRELLIVQLAIIAGMRPGEIFGLTWKRVGPDYADIRHGCTKARSIPQKQCSRSDGRRSPIGKAGGLDSPVLELRLSKTCERDALFH